MPLEFAGAVKSIIKDGQSQFWASCWRITLTTVANRVYRFTDSTEAITFATGETFEAQDGMDGSAEQRRDKFRGANRDVRGLISDSQITDADLMAGLYVGAIVDEYLVDTRAAEIAPISTTRYYIQGTSFDGATWTAEVDGIGTQYSKPVGEYWGPVCRSEVFDTGPGKCNLSTAGFEEIVTIDIIVNPRLSFTVTTSNPLWTEAGYGQDGRISFITGNNAGFVSRIRVYTTGGGAAGVGIQNKTPYDIQVGDAVAMLPGCNKQSIGTSGSPAHCRTRFNNIVNFQGEAFIPGGDRARRGVSVR